MAKPKTTTGEETPKPTIKFIQITGDADGLYGLDEEGRVFLYDDDDEGWFQLDFDDTRTLADEVSE